MSCADTWRWEEFLAQRASGEGVLSGAQREHLQTCSDCRRAISRRDASIPFALALDTSAAASGQTETETVGAILDAVRAMRRANRIDAVVASRFARRRRSLASAGRWSGLAAAAGLFGLALLVGPGGAPSGTLEPSLSAPEFGSPAARAQFVELAEFSDTPLVEDLGRPKARVYELAAGRDDVSVVLIVDESLDV